MSLILQLGILLSFLVTADSSVPRDHGPLAPHTNAPDKRRDDEKEKFVRCLMCKAIMRPVMSTVRRKIFKKLFSPCRKFTPSPQKSCKNLAEKLGNFLYNTLFPGPAAEMCKKLNMC